MDTARNSCARFAASRSAAAGLVEDLFFRRARERLQGRGVEFEEVRPYVPGDEVRDIDWNVTARTGHPYVKRFVEERS